MTNDKLQTASGKRCSIFVICVFFIGSFVLRLVPLGRYVTPDEPAWIYRSILFADALAARDWASIPSTGHPGVTTMWLGAAGVAMRRLLTPAESAVHLDWIRRLAWLAPGNDEAFRHLAFFLPWGRVAAASITTLCLGVLYMLLRRAFDRYVALLTAGLLAFDPFFIGHAGLLHTDALLAAFCLLALVTAFLALRESRSVAWWGLAGFFAGLALLTKTPAVLVVPFVLGLIVLRFTFYVLRFMPHWSPDNSVRDSVLAGLFFLAAAGLTVFILHPGLWVDPISTLETAFSFTGRLAEAAPRPISFAGEMTYDPGPFFYPAVFLFRVSPVVLIGLIVGLIALPRFSPDRRWVFLLLLAFAFLFGVGMSLGAKKHDRYLLPAFPPLTLAAALGISALVKRYAGILITRCADRLAWLPDLPIYRSTNLLIILLQLVIALLFAAHPLRYANPLAGGPWIASRVLSMSWGEGMGAAARRLNQRSDVDQLTVAAADVPSFASLFKGHTVPFDEGPSSGDYIVAAGSQVVDLPVYSSTRLPTYSSTVIYTNTAPSEQAAYLADRAGADDLVLLDADTPLLRRYEGSATLLSAASLPDEPALADWLLQQVPGHDTIWLVSTSGGSPITAAYLRRQIETVAVPVSTADVASAAITQYAVRNAQNSLPAQRYRATFGGRLALVDAAFPQTAAWPGALDVVLRWRAPNALSADCRALVVLRCDAGHIWSSVETPVLNEVFFPTSAWEAGEWSDASYELRLPPGIPPGRYAVEVSLYDASTGALLGASGPDGAFGGTRVRLGEMMIDPPAGSPRPGELAMDERLDVSLGPLTLLGWDPPATEALSGDYLDLGVFWQADDAPKTDKRVQLRLVGPEGEVGMEAVAPLSPYPTSRWQAGDRFQSRHTLHIPPDLSPGSYRLMLSVLDSGSSVSLATIDVLPRERSFALPDEIPHPLDLTFGDKIHLRGYELDLEAVAPGETLPLALYWQADGPTARSYTLFVHLLGPDGLVHGQVDRVPGDGSAPTTSWAAGQVIVEDLALPVAADAPPGSYRIAVGFYDPDYGDRLPVADASGDRLADDRAVLPVDVPIVEGAQ